MPKDRCGHGFYFCGARSTGTRQGWATHATAPSVASDVGGISHQPTEFESFQISYQATDIKVSYFFFIKSLNHSLLAVAKIAKEQTSE